MPSNAHTTAPPTAVVVVSLGCAKNLVDTEVMCAGLLAAGLGLVSDRRTADVLLLNTCAFVGPARAEAAREITGALRWKRRRAGRRVVVAGCLPQRDAAAVRREFPAVDLLLGLDDVPRAGALIAALVRQPALAGAVAGAAPAGGAAPAYLYDDQTPRLQLTPKAFAYVKIADGCANRCHYCVIPRIRGPLRSRTADSVVAECRNLLAQGVHELNLVAQDTTAFGHERGERDGLVRLLQRLDALPGEFWLRLLYAHPRSFTDELLDVFAGARHLVPYVDLPLQHVSDRMLERMGRRIGGAAVRALLDRLRERVPAVAIRTTVLVGHPGETAADFAELERFVTEFRFARLGVFAYSPEPGTVSALAVDDAVPPALAAARRARLLELQQGLALAANRELVGRELPVLVERIEGRGRFRARTSADAPDVDNVVHGRGLRANAPGGFVRVRVTAAGPYDLEAVALGGSCVRGAGADG